MRGLHELLERPSKRILAKFGYVLKRRQPRPNLALYRRAFSERSIEQRRFYNVGAGRFRHPCWTNIDHGTEWYAAQQRSGAHLEWDMMSSAPLPIATATAEIVYSSHTIEHVTNAAGRHFFAEAHRSLKPGGILRITCPDVDLALSAYRRSDREFFYWQAMYQRPEQYERIQLKRPLTEASVAQLLLWFFATHAAELHADGAAVRVSDAELASWLEAEPVEQVLDRCTALCVPEKQSQYAGNHINWYNARKLIDALSAAGFGEVWQSGYGQSTLPVLRDLAFFDNTHPKMSLYVEARR